MQNWFKRAFARFVLGAGIIVFGGISCGAHAADLGAIPTKAPSLPPMIESPWTFTLTPYSWLTSLNGSGTVANQTKNVDATVVDLMRQSEIPKGLFETSAFFEARKDRWSVFTDITYQKVAVAENVSGSRTLAINGIPIAVASGSIAASANFQMLIAEFGAAYEVATWQSAVLPGVTAVDLYAGGRVWWQQADFDLGGDLGVAGLGPFGLTRSGGRVLANSGDIEWVDPMIGARLRHQFAPGQEVMVRGDIGGFDVGSRFSWQAIGAYSFQFAKTGDTTWSGMIGYKAQYADYSQGSGITYYRYDIIEHGPIVGVSLKF